MRRAANAIRRRRVLSRLIGKFRFISSKRYASPSVEGPSLRMLPARGRIRSRAGAELLGTSRDCARLPAWARSGAPAPAAALPPHAADTSSNSAPRWRLRYGTGCLTDAPSAPTPLAGQVTEVILHGMHLGRSRGPYRTRYNHGKNRATTYLPLLGLKKKVTVQFSQ